MGDPDRCVGGQPLLCPCQAPGVVWDSVLGAVGHTLQVVGNRTVWSLAWILENTPYGSAHGGGG